MSDGFGAGSFGSSTFGDGLEGGTLSNLSFEVGVDGTAAGWDLEASVATGEVAGFGPLAVETYERGWGVVTLASTVEDVGLVSAGFSASFYASPRAVEDFEAAWSNSPYLTTSFPAIAVSIATDGTPFESFAKGWDNDPFLYAFTGGDLTPALIGGGVDPFDSFESDWQNTSYLFVFAGGLSSPSLSGALAKTVEDFEDVRASASCTGDAATDTFETIGHGLAVGYRVVFALPVAGAMPLPIAPTIPYYVQTTPTADRFRVALTSGAGAAIDLTTDGSGLLAWSAPWEFWTSTMATI